MGMVAIKCPGCGADIELDDSREFGFCNYCGTKVMQDKIVVEHKGNITIDESRKEKNLEKRLIELLNTHSDLDRDLISNKCEEILLINPDNDIAKYVSTVSQTIKSIKNKPAANIDTALLVEISIELKSIYRSWGRCVKYIKKNVDISQQDNYIGATLSFSGIGLNPNLYYKVMNMYRSDIGEEFYNSLITKMDECFGRNIDCYYDGVNSGESIVAILAIVAYDYPQLKNEYLLKIRQYQAKYPDAIVSSDTMDILNTPSSTSPNRVSSNSTSVSSGGCYVATSVYGSYDCPQVWTLRRYRDYSLALTWYGRLFIALYYAISPTIVKWFGDTLWFKSMWKGKLDKMVKRLQEEGFEDTPYNDIDW